MTPARYARMRVIEIESGVLTGVIEVAAKRDGPWRRPGRHLLRRLHDLVVATVNGVLVRDKDWRPKRRRVPRSTVSHTGERLPTDPNVRPLRDLPEMM